MKYYYLFIAILIISSCNCHQEKASKEINVQETVQTESTTVANSTATVSEVKESRSKEKPKGDQPKAVKEVKDNVVKENVKEVKTSTPTNDPTKTVQKEDPKQNPPIVKKEAPQETPLQKAVNNYAKLAEAYRAWMVESITEGNHETLEKAIAAQKAARKLEPDLIRQQKDFNAEQTNSFNAARKKLNKSEADFVKEM